MVDALGQRAKIGVVVPSTNTIVQPDFDALRPDGVTNHVARIMIPNMAIQNDDDFLELMKKVEGELYAAVDRVMTAAPDYLVIGISSTIFWDGYDASEKRRQALEDHTGIPTSGGSFALAAALEAYGVKKVAAFSPYQPIADAQVTKFLTDRGFEVVRFKGLRCADPHAIAAVSEDELRRLLIEIDGDDVEAIVQVGTNLSMARLAAEAERWLGKPVIAINPATYWHTLRRLGIRDRIAGHSPLLTEH
ncbi:MAG: arylmalonate decarboxylase [Alphaproteobacteria bacterium]|jgi:maleate isomerase|nr:arylmalonate decarboxylase [Alphaproteobacteria bacterium]